MATDLITVVLIVNIKFDVNIGYITIDVIKSDLITIYILC